jgi:hypothetical protein
VYLLRATAGYPSHTVEPSCLRVTVRVSDVSARVRHASLNAYEPEPCSIATAAPCAKQSLFSMFLTSLLPEPVLVNLMTALH